MIAQGGNNYSFGEKIGAGSYSTVFKAYQKGPDKQIVAIKVIEKAQLSPSAIDNLITEIRLLKTLKHSHIVEMKDFFWDDKNIMIVMEYCGGGDLSNFIKRRRRLPEIVCRRFLQQLATALQYIRSRNISHMDLKPSNLLLSSNQVLKLADFGFAQYLSCEEKKNSLRGSPLYMAPEMLLEHKYDAKVDLWSVGVIMYECLFGKAPYSSSTFEELADKIKQKAPIEIPGNVVVSAGCVNLLRKLLVHDPDQRIDFESFFKSDYLDLEHMPSDASMEKAVNLVHTAVSHDTENKPREAFKFYCDALQYFIPLINAETDETKKVVLRNKVDQYVKRAEELKVQLNGGSKDAQQPTRPPEDSYRKLVSLCASTPKLVEALEIGHVAEQYVSEGKHTAALANFQLCIGTLLGFLANEPAGPRKELLHRQAQQWLQLAEVAKRSSTLQTYDEDKKEASVVGKGIYGWYRTSSLSDSLLSKHVPGGQYLVKGHTIKSMSLPTIGEKEQ